jgi:hypothetical protein
MPSSNARLQALQAMQTPSLLRGASARGPEGLDEPLHVREDAASVGPVLLLAVVDEQAMRRGRSSRSQAAQNASGCPCGPPGVELKLGIGSSASAMSRCLQGWRRASSSVGTRRSACFIEGLLSTATGSARDAK